MAVISTNSAEKKFLASTEEIRATLAQRIIGFIGKSEDQATTIPGFAIYRRDHPTGPIFGLYEPSLTLLVQGRKRVMFGQEAFAYGPSRYLLTSVNVPVIGQVVEASPERPYLCLFLKLDLGVARQLLIDHDLPVPNRLSSGRGIATSSATFELFDAFSRLLAIADKPKDIPILGPLIQREIVYRLLTGEAGARFREIVSSGSQSHRTQAANWIRINYARPLRIQELAASVKLGVSTLHHQFRAMTSMSPLQYQKQLRLQEARRLMVTENYDAGGAALEVGYESTTQFSREYSRLFGQPPIRNVRALRHVPGKDPLRSVV
ncbi:MAG TPA: AraC family transcriptional regulator [Edaphobacter sp.]|nr:AraC family transcriptional regulator [Edaphobacter sp.]